MPLYTQISRGDCVHHLSEHYGDGVPGSAILIPMTGIDEYNKDLLAKQYNYYRPGLIDQEWGLREMHLIDPFGNRLRFVEPIPKPTS